jgi:LysM repeat protein
MIETAPQNIQAQKHFVQKGQTLYKIALLYGVKIADLRLWNKMQPENDKIYEGQTLIVGTPTQRGAAPQDNKYAYRILQSSNRTAIPTFYQKTQKAQMLVKLQETKIRRNLTENKNTNKCVKRTDRPKEPKK